MKKNIFVILLFSLTLSACKHPIQDKLDAYYDIFDKNLPNMIKFLDEYPIEKQQLFSCEVNTETHTYGKHRIISDNEAQELLKPLIIDSTENVIFEYYKNDRKFFVTSSLDKYCREYEKIIRYNQPQIYTWQKGNLYYGETYDRKKRKVLKLCYFYDKTFLDIWVFLK